uniref:FtsB family cell division protein n=1 Tax=Spirosoma sp. SC4-14 TaxID=3128900 RepID=UPI00403F3A28
MPSLPQAMFSRLLSYFRNFYVATGLGLLVWMTFFDANDLPTQISNWWKLHELENEAEFYQTQIRQIQTERKEVLGNDRLREKFAREKYLMKKPTEDIFVIVDENNNPIEK